MPVTLAQAKARQQDAIKAQVIDQFRKETWLMDNLTFEDTVTPTGRSLTFGYFRVNVQPVASTRALNANYTPQEADTVKVTGELKIMGGSFQIDRVIARGVGVVDEVEFQLGQKTKAAISVFHDLSINGDVGVDATQFDGLKKALAGTTQEQSPNRVSADWTTLSDAVNANNHLDTLDALLDALDAPGTALLMNTDALSKIRSIARRATMYTADVDALGRRIERYGNVVLIDMGAKPGSVAPIIPTETRTVEPLGGGVAAAITGLTDLYAVRLGLDGVDGFTMDPGAGDLISTYLDDFTQAHSGAVKTGEVEAIAALAIKNAKAAAVLKNIKVKA